MNTRLLEFLVKAHTKEGDVVLDPMAGSGSTGIVSALNGRNAVCVELEEKFHGWMEEARGKVESSATLAKKGNIVNIKGDARELSKLLVEADVILTSPPYSESLQAEGNYEKRKERLEKAGFTRKTHGLLRGQEQSSKVVGGDFRYSQDENNIGNLPHGNVDAVIGNLPLGNVDAVITSPPYADGTKGPSRSPLWNRLAQDPTSKRYGRKKHPTIGEGYGKDNDNIGNLPFADVVITSPPYAEILGSGHKSKLGNIKKQGSSYQEFGDGTNPQNLGNFPHGNVDAVITSPPYARDKGGEKGMLTHDEKRRSDKTLYKTYAENPDNIDNLSFIDSVITSPPYSEGTGHGRGKSTELQTTKKLYLHGAGSYSKSEKNIGEISGHETYLEAMLKVYKECWKVLKPGGSAIIVIKPFIRNKKVVDLPWHTWLLLEKVGFKLMKLYKLRLKQDSFWRVLYKKKYPDVPQIKHEYVLVCQK